MRPLPPLPNWVALEHRVAQILTEQEIHGWYFDERAAWKLASSLRSELEQTYQLLRDKYPFVFGSEFTPKRDNRTSGYVKGAPFTKLKELNPTSRDHIAWILKTFHGWKPTQLSPTGKPIIDEVVLKENGCLRWAIDCFGVSEMSRYYEELGDDIRRHQRMAQAMYEC